MQLAGDGPVWHGWGNEMDLYGMVGVMNSHPRSMRASTVHDDVHVNPPLLLTPVLAALRPHGVP